MKVMIPDLERIMFEYLESRLYPHEVIKRKNHPNSEFWIKNNKIVALIIEDDDGLEFNIDPHIMASFAGIFSIESYDEYGIVSDFLKEKTNQDFYVDDSLDLNQFIDEAIY